MDDSRLYLPKENVFRYLTNEIAHVPPDASAPLILLTASEMETERKKKR